MKKYSFIGKKYLPVLVFTCSYSLLVGLTFARDVEEPSDIRAFTVNMHGAVNAMSERCDVFEYGGAVSFSFSSPYPLDFNVHHHGELTTSFPVKLSDQTTYQGVFIAEPNEEYCFMWQNKTSKDAKWTVETHLTINPVQVASQ